ncbi:MAG TPA: Do family serine endopeptidase, partial [Blastocatellia bacterium]|nr:Do family serine endopeptidase [Blastocatellia bacterium]
MDNIAYPQRSSSQKWLLFAVIGMAVLIVGALAGSALAAKGWSPFKSSNSASQLLLPDNQPRVTQALTLNTGFSAVAKAVTPAVVTVTVSSRVRASQSPFFDPFRDFFGRPNDEDEDEDDGSQRRNQQTPRRGPLQPNGFGSGVIVTPDGYILTNNHVVDGAEKVEVGLPDRRTFTARVVGTDPPSDIAVIKIEGTGLPTIPFGDSNTVEVGDLALAIGNPLGIGQTVTMGIISAKGRSTRGAGRDAYEDFIQTDAPINRGNSGGALVNLKGELIGIPSQILSQTGGSIGIGFAIPASMARKVMEDLVKNGKVRRGLLGVEVRLLTPDLAESFGFKGTQGVFVDNVSKDLSAERAGVKPGDIITEFEGHKVEDPNQFRNLVSQSSPGSTVKFKVWRDGSERELSASLVEAGAKNGETGKTENNEGSDSNTGGDALAGI